MIIFVRQKGFTLIETIVFIVVISIGMVGIMSLSNTLIQQSATPIIISEANAIALSYMDEILGKPFYDPATQTVCPAPPVGRINFDNVCDYSGYFNHSPVTNMNGTTFGRFSGFSVTADIIYPATLGALPNADVIQVNVIVYHSEIPDFKITGYRTVY